MMKRVKVRLIGKGTRRNPYRVNLPTWGIDCQRDSKGDPIVDKDDEPIDSIDYDKKECYVMVPDDEVKTDGKLDQERIRKKYGKWKDFNAGDVELPHD